MRILYVTTIGLTMGFFPKHFKMLQDAGHIVELACNTEQGLPEKCKRMGLKIHHIPFSRSPFSFANLKALKILKKLVKEGGYDIVHTHTPNASICVRIACKKLRKKGLKVFYTAHGFHFYKGASKKNWLLYYPIEKICSRWTDVLITINREDYTLAQKRLRAKNVVYVPGVGIDLDKFYSEARKRNEIRKELEIPEESMLLISIGELNNNKNHETVIKAINGLDVYYIIAGVGDKMEYLQNLIDEQNMADRIKLLGYRTDVRDLYIASDIFVFPSFREGLSVSLMEAMASGLPCIVSRIRGNIDLIDENGGALFSPYDVEDCREQIIEFLNKPKKELGEYNQVKVYNFSDEQVLAKMANIYFD